MDSSLEPRSSIPLPHRDRRNSISWCWVVRSSKPRETFFALGTPIHPPSFQTKETTERIYASRFGPPRDRPITCLERSRNPFRQFIQNSAAMRIHGSPGRVYAPHGRGRARARARRYTHTATRTCNMHMERAACARTRMRFEFRKRRTRGRAFRQSAILRDLESRSSWSANGHSRRLSAASGNVTRIDSRARGHSTRELGRRSRSPAARGSLGFPAERLSLTSVCTSPSLSRPRTAHQHRRRSPREST